MTNPRRLAYNPTLDGMRALGILAVILFHLEVPGSSAGYLGVDIFFVLSGFLITTYLMAEWLDTGRIQFRRFYARRLLRLLPAALLLLAACRIVGLVPPIDEVVTGLGLSNLGIGYYLVPGMNERPLIHTWSLAAEWQYYLIWPVVLILLLRGGVTRRKILVGLLLLVLATGVWRAVVWDVTQAFERTQYAPDTRSDGLLWGSAIALLLMEPGLADGLRRSRLIRPIAYVGFVATLGLIASNAPFDFFLHGAHTLLVLAAGALLLGLAVKPPRPLQYVFANPAAIWIGKISFGLYLWHVPILQYLVGARGYQFGSLQTRATVLVLSFAAAVFSYFLVELPALRFKGRLGDVRPRPPVPASTP